MKLNTMNDLNQNILSIPNTTSRASTFPKQKIQSLDSITFSSNTKKSFEEKTYTRKERMRAAWNAIKEDCKNPHHKVITISGVVGLITIPLYILASLFFLPAAPILHVIAAGSSVYSGVALWRSFPIARKAYKNPT